MDRNTIIDKIKKCLALAESSNPHEAAAAMRQAQKLMEMHDVDGDELAAADVGEAWERSGAVRRPPRYEVGLASMIASAFGCELLFSTRVLGQRYAGGYAFIGVGAASAIAQYAFRVLARQLRAARADYIRTALKRCGPKNKVARADLFCEGWVRSVRGLIADIAPTQADAMAIEAFMRTQHPSTSTLVPTSRKPGRHVSEVGDQWSGYVAGKSAELNRGLAGMQPSAPLLA